MKSRGRCVKCGEWGQRLTLFAGMLLDDKCLIDEQDKAGHEEKVQNLETYRRLVEGTNCTDTIDEA